jgi:hypothetical protein
MELALQMIAYKAIEAVFCFIEPFSQKNYCKFWFGFCKNEKEGTNFIRNHSFDPLF